MQILVLRGGALGDFLVTLPALHLLRTHWPSARIELAGNARAAELAILSGLLDAAHSQHEGRWSALFSEAPLPRPFSAWLDRFDLVVSYWPDVDGALRQHFAHRGKTYIGSHARPMSRPAARHFCDSLSVLGLKAVDFHTRLSLPDTVKEQADQRLGGFKDFLAVHPGSGARVKNWPPECWVELCQKLYQPILIVTGEAERVAISWPEDLFFQQAHEWPLPILAAALQRCSRYLGNDTGVSHLAAAVGARSLLLFGPTDPEIWAPPGDHVTTLRRGPSMSDIPVDDVILAMANS